MDTQQANLRDSSSNTDSKLIDDKEPPSVDSSFSEKEDSSAIHQRILTSQQNAPTSVSPTLENVKSPHKVQAESQIEELSPSFCMFYKTVMILSALMSAGRSLFFLLSGSKLEPDEQFEFGITCWVILQSASAYQGFTKRYLKEIEDALKMMMTTFLFIGLSFGTKYYHQVMNENQDKEKSSDYGLLVYGVLLMGLHMFLHFLPTRKIRNMVKLALQEEEEKRQMEAQDPTSIKELDSALFLIYRYGLFVWACLGVYDLMLNIFEDFSDDSRFLEKMMSESNFFLPFMKRYGLNLFSNLFSVLAFEGIRKRNLKKISISAMFMKIFLVAHLLLEFHNGIAWDNEGYLMWKHKKGFLKLLHEKISFTLSFLGLFHLGVFKAQEILKAHQKLPRYSL